MRSINSIRESLHEDDGSIRSHAAFGIGGAALALAIAGGAFFWMKNGGVSAEVKTNVTFDAQTIADKIEFPATMRLMEVHGESSSTAKIVFQISPKLSAFGKEVGFDQDIGSVEFPTKVAGTVGIEFEPLQTSDTPALPNANNSDKNYKIVIEEKDGQQYAVVEVDPSAISAHAIDVATDAGNTDVITQQFGNFLDSSTIEQITTGSQRWNNENLKTQCAKNNATFENIELGLVYSITAISQGVSDTILTEIKKELPDHPEAITSATNALQSIFNPQTMQIRFVKSPNSASPQPASVDDTPIAKMKSMDAADLTRLIGLKSEYTSTVSYTFGNNYCAPTEVAKQNLDAYKSLRESATPYDEAQINRNASK